MKVILSRKGFDSAAGGCASPIMPDGTLLSMPIPVKDDGQYATFGSLNYNGRSYASILTDIAPNTKSARKYKVEHPEKEWCVDADYGCHLDPDILDPDVRPGYRKKPEGWHAAFGQAGGRQTELSDASVAAGDLFLYFGWFRDVVCDDGKYRYDPRGHGGKDGVQAIFGYLQIEKIETDKEAIQRDYGWHPHAREDRFWKKDRNGNVKRAENALYIAKDRLELGNREIDALELPGFGTFGFDERLVLTKEGESRSRWDYDKLPKAFEELRDAIAGIEPFSITHHPNPLKSFTKDYFQSEFRGQEFVMSDNSSVTKWTAGLFRHLAHSGKIN